MIVNIDPEAVPAGVVILWPPRTSLEDRTIALRQLRDELNRRNIDTLPAGAAQTECPDCGQLRDEVRISTCPNDFHNRIGSVA